jgi:hypothetical protein
MSGYGNEFSITVEEEDMDNPLAVDIVDVGSVIITLTSDNKIEANVYYVGDNNNE